MMEHTFKELYAIDVTKHIEKKGNFSYLSWSFAVAELRKAVPDATWETIKFDGKPYCETKAGCFVEVAVTVNGITLSQIHPVLDSRNATILAPNAFQINTSIQRCLVKAIALHGLGLYIYAGEDLPEDEDKKPNTAPVKAPLLPSKAPNLMPPPLSQDEINLCIKAMNECTDYEVLKGVFGSVYKRANELQKKTLTDIYSAKKALLEKVVTGE